MSHHVGYQTGKVLSGGVGAIYLGSLPGHPQRPPASLMVATLVDGGRFTSPLTTFPKNSILPSPCSQFDVPLSNKFYEGGTKLRTKITYTTDRLLLRV